ncbi:hypothetical protein HCN44_009916 [Aphidius gifuensis]|uniref:Uncharacterized protein n=1 Tax=Aphidius gifuensis TaxID=684658 RepID=A0A835CW71_APHGI|nr:hypothetical protein HCN44_009914 [Aphidius gifuensis]KAF7996080.1 hypothetical protein HCN44_009916 [Aphidius gifuensis]
MAEKLYALVKWTNGEDIGKFTVGINVNHIKQFNVKEFKNGKTNPGKIWTIEWHATKDKPLGGWNCYPALTNLDPYETPEVKSIRINPKLCRKLDLNEKEDDLQKEKPKRMKKENQVNEQNQQLIDYQVNSSSSSSLSLSPDLSDEKFITQKDLHTALLPIHNILAKIPNIIQEALSTKNSKNNPNTSDSLVKNETDKPKTSTSSNKITSEEKKNSDSNTKLMKELFEDTNIWIPKVVWLTAKEKKTFTAMATTLVPAVFSREELIHSNVRGGISKVKKDAEKKKTIRSR